MAAATVGLRLGLNAITVAATADAIAVAESAANTGLVASLQMGAKNPGANEIHAHLSLEARLSLTVW